MNKTGLIAKISIKYVLPTCIWKYFWRISRYFAFFGEFRGSATARNIRSPDYERVGISIVEGHGRVKGNIYVICVCGRELTDEFYGFYKVQKLSIFVIDSYLKDNTFTAVKRECS